MDTGCNRRAPLRLRVEGTDVVRGTAFAAEVMGGPPPEGGAPQYFPIDVLIIPH
jgi:hypothetical protein